MLVTLPERSDIELGATATANNFARRPNASYQVTGSRGIAFPAATNRVVWARLASWRL